MTSGSPPGMINPYPCRPGALTRRCERPDASIVFPPEGIFTVEGRPARRSFSVGGGEGERILPVGNHYLMKNMPIQILVALDWQPAVSRIGNPHGVRSHFPMALLFAGHLPVCHSSARWPPPPLRRSRGKATLPIRRLRPAPFCPQKRKRLPIVTFPPSNCNNHQFSCRASAQLSLAAAVACKIT
jgi:hypothetical protein